jgi:small subunit ribosomal protein S16
MKRGGTKAKPFYRIIATDSRNQRDGKALDVLGYYNPKITANEKALKEFEIDEEKAMKWFKDGAQFSDVVKKLMAKSGILEKLKA